MLFLILVILFFTFTLDSYAIDSQENIIPIVTKSENRFFDNAWYGEYYVIQDNYSFLINPKNDISKFQTISIISSEKLKRGFLVSTILINGKPAKFWMVDGDYFSSEAPTVILVNVSNLIINFNDINKMDIRYESMYKILNEEVRVAYSKRTFINEDQSFIFGDYYPEPEISSNTKYLGKGNFETILTVNNNQENPVVPFLYLGFYDYGDAKYYLLNESDLNITVISNKSYYQESRGVITDCYGNIIIATDAQRKGCSAENPSVMPFLVFTNLTINKNESVLLKFIISYPNYNSASNYLLDKYKNNVGYGANVEPNISFSLSSVYAYPNFLLSRLVTQKINQVNYSEILPIKSITGEGENKFLYLISQSDQLILKEKQKKPRLKLVFVPIGYNETNYKEFKQVAEDSVNRFLEISPLRECKDSGDSVESIILNLSSCNITGCSEICDDGTVNNCQILVQECANKLGYKFDKAVGICNGVSCGGSCGGCAAQIPGKSVVFNAVACIGADPARIATHELGHAFGLYHTKSEYGLNGCSDNEGGACQGPNKNDCSLSKDSISKFVMSYCPVMEDYGQAGYAYLKNSILSKYRCV